MRLVVKKSFVHLPLKMYLITEIVFNFGRIMASWNVSPRPANCRRATTRPRSKASVVPFASDRRSATDRRHARRVVRTMPGAQCFSFVTGGDTNTKFDISQLLRADLFYSTNTSRNIWWSIRFKLYSLGSLEFNKTQLSILCIALTSERCVK